MSHPEKPEMKIQNTSSTLVSPQLTNRVPSNKDSLNRSLSPSGSLRLLLLFALAGVAVSSTAQAVVPAPDGGYPGGNTAEGQNALLSLTTGTFNTAVGWFSLRSTVEGQLNTAVGAGTL